MALYKALLLCLVVICAGAEQRNEEYIDVSLEQLSGQWVGDFDSALISVQGENGVPDFVCASSLHRDCANFLAPGHIVFDIDATTDTFSSVFTRFEICQTVDDAKSWYPICALRKIYPGTMLIETTASQVTYSNSKLEYKIAGEYPSCEPWKVFVENGKVKAYIQHTTTFKGNFMQLIYGIPYICDDNAVMNCNFDFMDFLNAEINFSDSFTVVCLKGSCLDIATTAPVA